MKFSNDIIKILYVREGYLPNYPYHLISDSEMISAFMSEDNSGYFYDNYPLLDDSLSEPYQNLVSGIRLHLDSYLKGESEIPEWVYSYMLGSVISINSDPYDIHDLFKLFNLDDIDGIFNSQLSSNCYNISKQWVKRNSSDNTRPATIFGEPHVIKALRLLAVSS